MNLRKIFNTLSIPDEIVYNLPYITLVGKNQIIIENYKGIIEYTQERMRIKTSSGILCIEGGNIILKNIMLDEIKIEGTISKLEYI